MKLDNIPMTEHPHFKGGEGSLRAKMYVDDLNRILPHAVLVPGATIGWHVHDAGSEIVYILSGHGKALYDGTEERLGPGDCHYCPKGHGHSLLNDGEEDLVFFAVVPNQ